METVAEVSDEELIRAGGTSELVRRYYGPVYGLARRLLRNPVEARDVAQETFARAFRHLGEFRRGGSFRTWIFSITANHIRDLFRRRKPSSLEQAQEETLTELLPPESGILREENRQHLRTSVDKLPFDQRIVVVLHFQQELPYAEIAETLGISVNAVRIRLYHALNALRKDLA